MLTAAVLVVIAFTAVAQQGDGTLTASIVVPPSGEPGDALVVAGQVLTRDGAPARGVKVYVYQTDARGYYSPGGRDERNPRLKGYLRTDEQGRYEVRTIRPGPYPGSGPPAHIHYELTNASGGIERFELVFEGDARMTDAIRRDAAARGEYTLCKPERDRAGVTHCRGANIYLK
jgi:protocatechuate 3,4-dioxygenase beta subunit